MIIARLQGGHSNQLFQYAVARNLSHKLGAELFLDLTWFEDFADVDTPRFYELGDYPLKAKTLTSLKGINVIDPRQSISKLTSIKRKLRPGKTVLMHYERHQGFNPEVLDLPDNTLLVGFWQTEKYFKEMRDILLKELEPSTKVSAANSKILKKIKETDAVSMHIRRGDYVTNKNAAAFHGLLGKEYYAKGLDYIKKKTKSDKLHAFIFSNDIEWCKKNMRFDIPVTFVEGNDKGSDDMRLMKHCKHFIMANSSFSWWGAWLSENENKIVVAPKKWFQDKKADKDIEIVPDSWVRI